MVPAHKGLLAPWFHSQGDLGREPSPQLALLHSLAIDSALRHDFGACSLHPVTILFYSLGDTERKAGQGVVPQTAKCCSTCGEYGPERLSSSLQDTQLY